MEDALNDALMRLRESEELYRHVVELSSLIPWTTDAQGNVTAVGDRWIDWTGGPRAAALGWGWLDYVHPDDVQPTRASWVDALRTGEPLTLEYRLRSTDGSYRWCHARATRRANDRDGAASWYGTLEDVHERRTSTDAFHAAQAELAQVSRLSAMGAVASVIAHDLNQPLTVMAHYIRGCKRLLSGVEGPNKQALEAALDDADKSIVHAGEIVRRARGFVTRGEVERRRESIRDLVENACRFALVDAAARGISHRLEPESDCIADVDRVQIQQVVVNLIRNAVEAVEGQERREIIIRVRSAGSDQCEVSVQDTGPGLSREAAARMFDPFYTTRKSGMGVGLSISRMIVESHGGSIRHVRRPKGGTIVAFTLPTVPPSPRGHGPVPASAG
jgi:two-component system, LuxR family, sensor kinase FixL